MDKNAHKTSVKFEEKPDLISLELLKSSEPLEPAELLDPSEPLGPSKPLDPLESLGPLKPLESSDES